MKGILSCENLSRLMISPFYYLFVVYYSYILLFNRQLNKIIKRLIFFSVEVFEIVLLIYFGLQASYFYYKTQYKSTTKSIDNKTSMISLLFINIIAFFVNYRN